MVGRIAVSFEIFKINLLKKVTFHQSGCIIRDSRKSGKRRSFFGMEKLVSFYWSTKKNKCWRKLLHCYAWMSWTYPAMILSSCSSVSSCYDGTHQISKLLINWHHILQILILKITAFVLQNLVYGRRLQIYTTSKVQSKTTGWKLSGKKIVGDAYSQYGETSTPTSSSSYEFD